MPKQAKEPTLLRQWTLLRLLTNQYQTTTDLTRKLHDEGFTVTIRTVQRDLNALSTIFSLELNDKNPQEYGWRIRKDTRLDANELTLHEALALHMAKMHLETMLPIATTKALSPLFGIAKNRLNQLQKVAGKSKGNWPDKIRVIQPDQHLLPPEIDTDIQDTIYQALMEEKCISVSYQSVSSPNPNEYELHPLAIILRGQIYYLVAISSSKKHLALYALHRFKRVETLAKSVSIPDGFNIDHEIEKGLGSFDAKPSKIQLNIKTNLALMRYLNETPLSPNQQIKPITDEQFLITAQVTNTWQLFWWLLSRSNQLEVIEPAELRNEIVSALTVALNQYQVN